MYFGLVNPISAILVQKKLYQYPLNKAHVLTTFSLSGPSPVQPCRIVQILLFREGINPFSFRFSPEMDKVQPSPHNTWLTRGAGYFSRSRISKQSHIFSFTFTSTAGFIHFPVFVDVFALYLIGCTVISLEGEHSYLHVLTLLR